MDNQLKAQPALSDIELIASPSVGNYLSEHNLIDDLVAFLKKNKVGTKTNMVNVEAAC